MEQQETKPLIESKKDFSNRWLDNIFDCLERLELYERQLKMGFEDLQQYIILLKYSKPVLKTKKTQLKAVELMITEIGILLNNSEKVIKNLVMQKLRRVNKVAIKMCNTGSLYQNYYNCGKVIRIEFKKDFNVIIGLLSSIRKQIVSELSPFLWIGKDNKEQLED